MSALHTQSSTAPKPFLEMQGRLGDSGKPPGEEPTQLTPSEAKAPRNDDAPAARPPVVAEGEVQYEGTPPLATSAKGDPEELC